MQTPYLPTLAIEPAAFSRLRRRAMLEFFKWDAQFEDVATLSPVPLVLSPSEWELLRDLAQRLQAEALAAEAELVGRPELHGLLGLPRAVRRALRRATDEGAARGGVRVDRFDFHFTTEGWRISEVNSDVPGGWVETSGFATLVAEHVPGTASAGQPARVLASCLARLTGARDAPTGATIALVHATSYADDRQAMELLASELRAAGLDAQLVAPDHLEWRDGRAFLATDWSTVEVAAILRFFPGEWLPELPDRCGWRHFFAGGVTPQTNPATALISQSKRFSLTWDELDTPLPTWRALLPETRDPRDVHWRSGNDWVVKPALGRVGEAVGIRGVTPEKEWRAIERSARFFPGQWAAQRRFEVVPLESAEGRGHPCVGVFVIGGKACGAYGRVATRPLIDARARDAAVLVTTSALPVREMP